MGTTQGTCFFEKPRSSRCQIFLKYAKFAEYLTMSSTEETDLKAGHAPAVKAGGMRVVTRPRHSSTGESKPEVVEDEEVEPTPPKSEKHNFQVNLSGAVGKGDKDFTPDAIKSYMTNRCHLRKVVMLPNHNTTSTSQSRSQHYYYITHHQQHHAIAVYRTTHQVVLLILKTYRDSGFRK